MLGLIVGVGYVTLYIRHARGLKDKRHVIKGLRHRLEKLGFSVSETGSPDNPKQGSLGFAYAGNNHAEVERQLKEGRDLFFGNFEVIQDDSEVFDYALADETDLGVSGVSDAVASSSIL